MFNQMNVMSFNAINWKVLQKVENNTNYGYDTKTHNLTSSIKLFLRNKKSVPKENLKSHNYEKEILICCSIMINAWLNKRVKDACQC